MALSMYNFSIIIPHRNSYNLLVRCLDSIPNRDDLQIIVVDDNSEKATLDSLNSDIKKRKNVELIPLVEEKGGAGHARNVGLSHAQGKWILFSDCDDEYSADLNELMDQYLDSNYDVVYYDYIYKYNQKESEPVCSSKRIKGDNEAYLKYKVLAPWNKMVKKSLIDKNNIFFEECPNGNDLFYSFQVGYYSNNVCFSPDVIYHYYRNVIGITNRRNTDSGYLCSFEHLYKCNNFYRFIGQKQWCQSVIVKLISILYKQGVRAMFQATKVFLRNKKQIIENQNAFVDYFISHSASSL